MELDDANNFLQYSNYIWMNTTEAYGGSGAFVQVGGHDMYPGLHLYVGSPAKNYAQAEVYNTSLYPVLMGGSSTSPGEFFQQEQEDTTRVLQLGVL